MAGTITREERYQLITDLVIAVYARHGAEELPRLEALFDTILETIERLHAKAMPPQSAA